MSESQPRPVLARISPNRVAKPARRKPVSRLPVAKFHQSPTSGASMDEYSDGNNDDTQSSIPKSDDSNISNLSLLADETPTDDFGRKILAHARWSKRSALESGPVKMQAFGKANSNARLANIMGDVGRRDGDNPTATDNSPERRDEPIPQNVPRRWGSKGRQRNEFLKRLNSVAQVEESTAKLQPPSPASGVALAAADEKPNATRGVGFTTPHLEGDITDSRIADGEHPPLGTDEEMMPTQDRSSDQHYTASKISARNTAVKAKGVDYRAAQAAGRTDLTSSTTGVERTTGLSRGAADDLDSKPRKHGSRELLQQLARAASATPSPSSDRNNGPAPSKRTTTSLRGNSPSSIPRYGGNRGKKPRDGNPAMATHHRLPTPPEDILEDSNPETQSSTSKPPFAAGSNSEIPAHSQSSSAVRDRAKEIGGKRYRERSLKPGGRRDDKSARPPQARSALEALVVSQDSEMIGDALAEATIQSFKDLVAQDEAGELSAMLQLDEDTLKLVSNVTLPVRHEEGLRREEKEALKRMGEALKSARISIRDASQGIERVEHHFEQVDNKQSQQDTTHICERCGSSEKVTLGGLLLNAWSWYCSWYYSWPKNGHLRLTWLGLVTLIFWTWLITEITLCEIYCHPIYAKSMVGYGVDINAPRLPYVAATILVKRPLEDGLNTMVQIVGGLVGSFAHSRLSALTGGHTGTAAGNAARWAAG